MKDRSIEAVAKNIAEKYRENFNLSEEEVYIFTEKAEKIIKQIVGRYTLPGIKISREDLDKILQEIEVEITKEGYKLLGSKVHPSHRELRQMIKEKSK